MKDNSRFWAFFLLILIGGLLYFSKPPLQDPKKPAPATAPVKADASLVGNVKTLVTQNLRVGTGKTAKKGDQLTMNYRGTLLNGKLFDESYGKTPFQFQLGAGNVIKGWDQGILGMKEGGKRKLTIPASLGYGDAGSGEKIPGGATLVFEVELLKIGK